MELKEFEETVSGIRDKVYRFANRLLGSQPDAEDALQDIFLKLWSMREQLPGYKNVDALAMTMTRNLCLDRIKRGWKSPQLTESPEENSSPVMESPASALEEKDFRNHLLEIINALPAQQKMIIHLRDVEGYSFEELETMMDLNRNTIRVNLSRARKAVREQLTKLELHER